MRNFRIGKLRRLKCDDDGDDREASAEIVALGLSRRISVAKRRLSSASALD
jgi:hypothetical protein